MTLPEQEPSPEQMDEAWRKAQKGMRNYALHHLDGIDFRTLLALQSIGLVDKPVEPIGETIDLSVVRDLDHPRRAKLPAGPLLVYRTEGESPKVQVVELRVLFYSEQAAVREAVIECLWQMMERGHLETTPRTKAVFDKCRNDIASSDPAKWRAASIALGDSLHDDIFVALQGVQQSIGWEEGIQESLNVFASCVMYPSVSSLDSVLLDVRNPEKEHARLLEIVHSVVSSATSLGNACASYYSRLGFLPLSPPYAMSAVVSEWIRAHPQTDAWKEVWNWVRSTSGPVPRYHACSAFVTNPELVPDGRLSELWDEILVVVGSCEKKGNDATQEAPWLLRRDLARHFAYHLETRLPDNDGVGIACIAWWVSQRVAALFQDSAESSAFYRKNWAEPALARSQRSWLVVTPHIGPSFLRYVTLSIQAPWAAGLLALMGSKLEALHPGEQSGEVRAKFHDALVSQLVSSLPFFVEMPSDPTYSLECSIGQTAQKWAAWQPEEDRKAIEQLVSTSRVLGTSQGLCEALRNIGDSSLVDQIAVAVALKASAYTNLGIAAEVWGVLSDRGWRQRVFLRIEERVLGILIEALLILQVEKQGEWFSLLPHYLAEVCEKAEDDERRRFLFLCVLHASSASDTVSAVRRLLHGEQRARFVGIMNDYRQNIENIWSDCPEWAQGRLRGLLASLHVT